MNLRPIILDRYILREFALSFLAVMAFCALLLLVASIFDRFSDILEYGASFKTIVVYFLASLPGKLMQIVPIAAMLAVLFSVGSLARTNEILAMLTSGVHALRLSLPIIFAGILIVIAAFFVNEYAVPPLERLSKIYELKMEQRDMRRITMNANVFARGRDGWLYLSRVYSDPDKQMIRPTIISMAPDHSGVNLRIEAKSAKLQGTADDGKTLWAFENPHTWRFDNAGRVTTYTEVAGTTVLPLEADLPAILAQRMKPAEMNFQQLKEHIDILQARQQPTQSLETSLLRKLTFPIGILVIMLIGFAYGVKSRAGTAMTIIGYGIGWAAVYYIVNALLQALGSAGTVPPAVATVVPLLVFAGIAFWLMRRSYQWHA
jgi:lipopolysaccharide export system permease protein